MKNSKLGLVLAGAAILVIGGVFLVTANHKPASIAPSQVVDSTPTPTSPVSPTVTPVVSKYSAAIKAKVRSEFIGNCQTKGHYTVTECNCAADYLAKNYTESELATIYLQYHTSSEVPAALDAASKACVTK